MNEIRREDRDSKLIHDIRTVVERHGWPAYIQDVSIGLLDLNGEPTVWITYKTKPDAVLPRSGWEQRADEHIKLTRAVSRELLGVDDRWTPYYSFTDPAAWS